MSGLYLNLLSEPEIRSLGPLLGVLRHRKDEVLDGWWALYQHHFAEVRSLTEPLFRSVYGQDLEGIVSNLLDHDLEGFELDERRLGSRLVELGVPFSEVVASLHLFEEASTTVFRSSLKVMLQSPTIHLTFDKLSHCRMILLAGAYFGDIAAIMGTRLARLERDAMSCEASRTSFHGLIGASEPMRRLHGQISAAASGYGATFVVGESGVGKELVARAVHELSGPVGRSFFAINCAALSSELIESELFGHRRGAYTGAQDDYSGILKAAEQGTVFLDEITEMAAVTQAKLLRVIEEGCVRPVGSTKEVPIRCRFVASTNRDPAQAVAGGFLRQDLLYRLNVHRLDVPTLRSRLDDVPLLVGHFLDLFARRGLRSVEGAESEALALMGGYQWPGNVRELRNAVEHALTVARGRCLASVDLPSAIVAESRPSPTPEVTERRVPSLDDSEKDLIGRALVCSDGNKMKAARMLGISRHKLYDKIRKFGLPA